jgi:thiosulfate dehydrogenase
MISQPRPEKAALDKDYPDFLTKPVDAPYGPYADGFDQRQHMYGPFGPIRAVHTKKKDDVPR